MATVGVDALVRLEGVALGYEGVVALRDVDLTIAPGELIGIVGPSGSGKTTLLRSLLGEPQLYAGTATVADQTRVGYVPQVETVDWNFPITVEQVVLLGRWRSRRWLPWVSRADHDRAHEVMDQLGISEFAHRPIRALSGGQQQRAFLGRALVGSPDLLLLDEPTSGVDIKTRHEILHQLAGLNTAGVTVVLTTHDLNGVASHLPRLIALGEQTVLADGPSSEVLQPGILERAYGQPMLVVQSGHETYVLPVPEEAPGAHGDALPPPEVVSVVGRPDSDQDSDPTPDPAPDPTP
ncbi:MAG: metal ABC transporter ATP-binding protein [Chloroflexota bacterium]|nr:metal ABC transporter ATP-binding protein [Chloroflexota bacterium]